MADDRKKLQEHLVTQRVSLATEGYIDLTDLGVRDLSAMGPQPKLIHLKLTGLPIESFETLPDQRMLKNLIADSTRLSSLKGLSRFPSVHSIDLRDTPLLRRRNLELECCILVGQKLNRFNTRPIPQETRERALLYPPAVKYLIEAGWEVPDGALTAEELRMLCKQYKVKGVKKLLDLPGFVEKEICEQEEERLDEDALVMGMIECMARLGINIQPGENAKTDVLTALDGVIDAARGMK